MIYDTCNPFAVLTRFLLVRFANIIPKNAQNVRLNTEMISSEAIS